jgi:CRP/FNR family cyclic AMP-dependent transcriptional regulator
MSTDQAKIKKFPCFSELSKEQQEAVAQLATEESFHSGHTLFEEGKPGTHIYLISNGYAEVLYNIGEEGPSRVDRVGTNVIVGCSALVDPYIYTSTTRCLTEIEAMIIEAEALRTVMNEDCALGYSIQKNLIRMLLDRITDLRLGL